MTIFPTELEYSICPLFYFILYGFYLNLSILFSTITWSAVYVYNVVTNMSYFLSNGRGCRLRISTGLGTWRFSCFIPKGCGSVMFAVLSEGPRFETSDQLFWLRFPLVFLSHQECRMVSSKQGSGRLPRPSYPIQLEPKIRKDHKSVSHGECRDGTQLKVLVANFPIPFSRRVPVEGIVNTQICECLTSLLPTQLGGKWNYKMNC